MFTSYRNLRKSIYNEQKMKFFIKDFFSKCDQICSFLQFPADLVSFTENTLNGKLHFCGELLVPI